MCDGKGSEPYYQSICTSCLGKGVIEVSETEFNEYCKQMKLCEHGNYHCQICEVRMLNLVCKEQKEIIKQQKNECIDVALYELEVLHQKVKPTKNSSIDSHFQRIIDILKNG